MSACSLCDDENCRVRAEINEGREADAASPEGCAVCDRRSYIVDPRTDFPIPCASCSRGFRLKLWLKHKLDCGKKIEPFVIAA